MNPLRLDWWRRAFAIPTPPPWDGDSAASRQLDWLAQQAVERGLAVPAVMLLESVRPLQGGAARLLPFFQPLWNTAATADPLGIGTDWTRLLEHPIAVDWLIARIEQRERSRARPPDAIRQPVVTTEPALVPGLPQVDSESETAP